MKAVFALASLIVAVQAMPQAAIELPKGLPPCIKTCIDTLNKSTCTQPEGSLEQAKCFCLESSTATLGTCVLTNCKDDLDKIGALTQQAKDTCEKVNSGAAAAPPAGESSAAASGDASKGTATSAAGGAKDTSAAASGEATATGEASATATDASSSATATDGGATYPSESAAASASGSDAEKKPSGTASGSAAASATGAAGRVAVGGSIILAGVAAALAL